jgi:hypothetical protein
MALTVNKAGVYKPTKQPYVKKVGVQKPGTKAYIKKAGVWNEVWPLLPNPPQNVHVATPQVGEIIVIDGTWTAPAAGATAATSYRVRAVFTEASGNSSPTAWVDKTIAQLSHRFDNAPAGWAHRSGQKVRIEVVSVIAATVTMPERLSSVATSEQDVTSTPVPTIVAPPAPTSFAVTISECELSQTWAHVGGVALDKFEIQTWLSGQAVTTYTVTETLRKWTTFPWNAASVGRATVNTRIRAVGQGGASAWVTVTGIMPGPVSLSNYGYSGGVSGSSLFCTVGNMDDGVGIYTQKYGAASALQSNLAGNANTVVVGYTNSFSHARDNVTKYRLGFLPRNAANGWTGRAQWGGWCIKLPNPVFIQPADCNTWWSIPIPGKWRTNPQAENWFYQGKSISGNSYGTLFFQNRVPDYFDVDRVGYSVAVTSWDVYTKRTNTGGLVAAVALNVWTHARDNDIYDAAPGLVNGPSAGPSLARDQKAWVPLSTSWWANMLSGKAKGVTYYVDPSAADNQLRSEIGNVSNRYMILDKPTYGSTLDGQIPGTLRIYHDG